MIVGAGLAGLMMAYLLERINVPYTVFERSAEVRPLGERRMQATNATPPLQPIYTRLQT